MGGSVDHVLTYSGRQIAVGSQKLSRIMRRKTCCASESNTSVRVVFANRRGLDAPIGVVLAWEERGSCLNIFRTTNHGQILETFTNYEAKDLLRKKLHELRGKRLAAQVSQTRRARVVFVNRSGFDAPIGAVLAWEERGSCLNISGRQIAVGSQKPSRITRQKTCCAMSQTRRFADRSGFDSPIGVVLAGEERGSCLHIFRMTNRGRISETFTNYEAKDLLRNESNTSVRVVFVNRSGFDALIGVVLAWEERGPCLNKFLSQTRRFALFSRAGVVLMLRLESSWHGRSVDHVLAYSGRQIAVGSQKPSRITRQKTCCASESTRRLALYSRTRVVLMLRLESSWHGRSVDHVLTYSGRQIAVGSQKPSRITRQKTCCASESNTSVRVVFANRSGFDAPIGVVLAWEEHGSCLNIFRTTNRGRISETFTNYEAIYLLRK
ncbi:uncharacterized protein G2W53_009796 [Senna tora]|uniref:Uncharacterized protein n=1 Tax=Senna tora TaxID=362788 RepID=A0A834WYL6_9FABA|nr:uncharacterized protein G2W53_009796 [Senna tora]